MNESVDDFYVQLMSNASMSEFPDKAHSFKNRLPNPLQLRESGWKVGISDLQPRHILYLPVRTTFLDIVETQVSENDGQLVNFASGVTTITLHFQKG